jgi:hypothetical protein
MILEARQEGCFSTRYLLVLDGKAVGSYRHRLFTQQQDVSLLGQRTLTFANFAFFGFDYRLHDAAQGELLAAARVSGWFTASMDLDLSIGRCRMERAALFGPTMSVRRGTQLVAHIGPGAIFTCNWQAAGDGLSLEDLLFIGLTYQARQRSSD